jgi:hypothetical protein
MHPSNLAKTSMQADNSSRATWTPTAKIDWKPEVSVQCRDDSADMISSNWITIIVNLGEEVLSALQGTVYDASGSPISGASVTLQGFSPVSTDADGFFSITEIPVGNYLITVSKSGYATLNQNISIPTSATVSRNFTIYNSATLGEIQILNISSIYTGHLFFLDGVDFHVTFAASVDWGEHPPQKLRFITPKNTYDVATSNTSAQIELNVGTEFGPCGKLRVMAISSDGTISFEKEADFTVMSSADMNTKNLSVTLWGNDFRYKPVHGLNMNFIEAGLDAGVIGSDFLFFGGGPFRIDWIPDLEQEISSSGKEETSLSWPYGNYGTMLKRHKGGDTKALIEFLKDKNSNVLPKLGFSNLSLNFFPMVSMARYFSPITCNWDQFDLYAGMAGQFEFEKSQPVPQLADLVFVDIIGSVSAELNLGFTGVNFNTGDINKNYRFKVIPKLGLGSSLGINNLVSAGLRLDTTIDSQFQTPLDPKFELSLTLALWATYELLLFEGEKELWTWVWGPYSTNTAAMSQYSASKLDIHNVGLKFMRRDYLSRSGYSQFYRNPKFIVHQISSESNSYETQSAVIQSSVFPHSFPSLSEYQSVLNLVWIRDNPQRSASNRTELVFASLANNTWTTPVALDDDGTADFHPDQDVLADGSLIVAWENVKAVMTDNSTVENFKQNLEISVALFDAQTKTFTKAVQLTDNAYLDYAPKVSTLKSDSALVTWISNEFNDEKGNSTKPNEIWSALWNGNMWRENVLIDVIAAGALKDDMLYDGTHGWLVMSLDMDNNFQTIADRELFLWIYENNTWSNRIQLTDNLVPDERPLLYKKSTGEVALIWLHDGNISSTDNFDMNTIRTIFSQTYSSHLTDMKIAVDENDNVALMWIQPSLQHLSDIFTILYDAGNDSWGIPKQLSADPEKERYISATFWGTEKVVAVFNRQIETDASATANKAGDVPKEIDSDLSMVQYTFGEDLALDAESFISNPRNPDIGVDAKITIKASNYGDLATGAVPIHFYLGDPEASGIFQGEVIISAGLQPGESKEVVFSWIVPEVSSPYKLFARIDPDQIYDFNTRENNTVSQLMGGPDFTVRSMRWEELGEKVFAVTVCIANIGIVRSNQSVLNFRETDENGPILSTHNIGQLAPDEAVEVTFTIDLSGSPLPNYKIFASVDDANLLEEFDECNNFDSLVIALDGDRDSDDIGDNSDNCPNKLNSEQADTDNDTVGDACDNCPLDANSDQTDSNNNGIGDLCDPDSDGDGVANDGDANGVKGDHPCRAGNVSNCDDNCPHVANANQADFDKDGTGDVCDNCPSILNEDQADKDGDTMGDFCDDDDDNDGIDDANDNCPSISNPDQTDTDADGHGDLCDTCPNKPDDGNENPDLCEKTCSSLGQLALSTPLREIHLYIFMLLVWLIPMFTIVLGKHFRSISRLALISWP